MSNFAFEMTLPNGVLVRRISTQELMFGLARREDRVWRANWFLSRRAAEIAQRRFTYRMQHGSGLRPDQYATEIIRLRPIPVPKPVHATVVLPGKNRLRHTYFPEWGESKPIAAVVVEDAYGWKTGSWVTTLDEQDREVRRLEKLHDRVMVCNVA